MPGVPPEAVDNVKKLLKGIFKRGKNKKQVKPVEQQAPSTSTQPFSAAATPQTRAATNGGGPNTDKPLPPTIPTASAPTSETKDTVPQKNDAPTTAVESAPEVKKESDSHGVSPMSATPAPASEPVSAVDKSTPPAPPPKDDAPDTSQVTAATAADKENVAPTASAQKVESAPKADTTAPTQTNGTAGEVKKVAEPTAGEKAAIAGDEKVPVNEEPAPVKPVQNAPGMSATSGPLEDFPEGGAPRD